MRCRTLPGRASVRTVSDGQRDDESRTFLLGPGQAGDRPAMAAHDLASDIETDARSPGSLISARAVVLHPKELLEDTLTELRIDTGTRIGHLDVEMRLAPDVVPLHRDLDASTDRGARGWRLS